MKQFEIYQIKIPYSDKKGGKNRPSIIVQISQNNKAVSCFGIYSHKKWWDNVNGVYFNLFAIHNIEKAGLKLKNSFIDISNNFDFPINRFTKKNYLGKLSTVDINLFNEKMISYHEHIKIYGPQKTFLELRQEYMKNL
jgi:hypothetical protein